MVFSFSIAVDFKHSILAESPTPTIIFRVYIYPWCAWGGGGHHVEWIWWVIPLKNYVYGQTYLGYNVTHKAAPVNLECVVWSAYRRGATLHCLLFNKSYYFLIFNIDFLIYIKSQW